MILTEKRAICAALAEPSSGLEPETPSLPWRIQAAKEGLRNSACWRVFPATTSLRRSGASFPRRALSLPQKPRTCPQFLSPDPRRTAPRPSIAPRRIRRNLASGDDRAAPGLHMIAGNIERLRRRCGSARYGPLAFEHFDWAAASPLRFGRRSIQSRPQPITATARRELSPEHERKHNG